MGQVINGILADLDQTDEEVIATVGRKLREHESLMVSALFFQGRYTIDFTPTPDEEAPTADYLSRMEFVFMRDGKIRVGVRGKKPDGTDAGGRMKNFVYRREGQ